MPSSALKMDTGLVTSTALAGVALYAAFRLVGARRAGLPDG